MDAVDDQANRKKARDNVLKTIAEKLSFSSVAHIENVYDIIKDGDREEILGHLDYWKQKKFITYALGKN